MLFTYEAFDKEGEDVFGEIDTYSALDALKQIRVLGYFPMKLKCSDVNTNVPNPFQSLIDVSKVMNIMTSEDSTINE